MVPICGKTLNETPASILTIETVVLTKAAISREDKEKKRANNQLSGLTRVEVEVWVKV